MPLQTTFQSAGVYRDRDTSGDPNLHVDVVAASDSFQLPTSRLEQTAESFAADGLHTAISMILPVSETGISCISTDRHPSTAS